MACTYTRKPSGVSRVEVAIVAGLMTMLAFGQGCNRAPDRRVPNAPRIVSAARADVQAVRQLEKHSRLDRERLSALIDELTAED